MGSHRSVQFGQSILPQAVRLVESIGHRIAYDAAVGMGVEKCLIDLYVVSCIKTDPGWYVEHAGLTQNTQIDMESAAVDAVFPRMDDLVAGMGVQAYAAAPITTQSRWDQFVCSLETFGGPIVSNHMSRM
jgi:acyl-CoA oxidase